MTVTHNASGWESERNGRRGQLRSASHYSQFQFHAFKNDEENINYSFFCARIQSCAYFSGISVDGRKRQEGIILAISPAALTNFYFFSLPKDENFLF
jgi:hypothetical protein